MDPRSVRIAGPDEREALIDTFVLSFSGDPCARYVWPKPQDFMVHWRAMVMAMGGRGLDHGTAWVTENGAAAALWLPPGVESDAEAIGALIGSTAPEAKLAVLGEVAEQMDRHHPKEPHWYLAFVGCDPACQGQGLGAALLKEGLRACDAQGMPAYLESSSPRNIPLYERHGFEVMGVIQPGDFPGIYPMYRPAKG
jgi:ribosomal protein S18 acetylase RimI-like enzyme